MERTRKRHSSSPLESSVSVRGTAENCRYMIVRMHTYRISLNRPADGNPVYVVVVLTFVSAKHNRHARTWIVQLPHHNGARLEADNM
jgi:hypothetical protein